MKKLLFILSLAVSAQTLQDTVKVNRIYDIRNQAPIDNRDLATRRMNMHTFQCTGSGTWTCRLQYSTTSVSGPWADFPESSSLVGNTSPNSNGSAFGYYNYIRVATTGTVTRVDYAGMKDVYLNRMSQPYDVASVSFIDQVTDKLVVDAREYGLNESASSATNSAAINAALASCPTTPSYKGCNVVIPFGTFNVSGGIVITGSQRLVGAGQYSTILMMTVPNTTVITMGSASISTVKASIEDLSIESNTTSASTSGYGVMVIDSYECDIRRVTISGYGGIHGGVYIDGANHLFIDRLFISNLATHGTSSPTSAIGVTCQLCNVLYMSNTTVGDGSYSCKAAFELRNGDGIYIRDSETTGFLVGMNITPGTGQVISWPSFDNLQLDYAVNYGMFIQPVGTGSVNRLRCVNCWLSSSTNGSGISMYGATGTTLANIEFIGGIIANNFNSGVYIDAPVAKGVTFSGGLIQGNNQAALYSSGIQIVNVGDIKIQGVRIGDDVSAPIQFSGINLAGGGSGYVTLRDNKVGGNLNGIYKDVTSAATLDVGPFLDVKDFGAKGDSGITPNASITATQTTLTSTYPVFSSSDVGKPIWVYGAGSAGNPLVTTISAYTSATQVTLAAPALTTSTSVNAMWGTDDTAAIQSALNSTIAIGSGGDKGVDVVFPPGYYKTSTLTIQPYTTLQGSGKRGSTLIQTTANSNLLTVPSAFSYGINLKGLRLKDVVSTSGGALLAAVNMNDWSMTDVILEGGYNGVNIQNNSTIHWLNISFTGQLNSSLLADGLESRSLFFKDVWTVGTTPYSYVLKNVSGLYWDNVANYGGVIGLWITPGAGQHVGDMFLSNCSWDTVTNKGVYIAPSDATGWVSRFMCTNCWSATNETGVWIDATLGTIRGIQWIGGKIINNTSGGIALLGDVKQVLLDGLTIGGNSTLTNGAYPGMSIGAGVQEVKVINSRFGQPYDWYNGEFFTNQQSVGITLYAGASDYIQISGNQFTGDIAPWFNGSTGTHNRVEGNVGLNPFGASSITVTASPFTYTAGPSTEVVYINGGTVSSVVRGATTVCLASPCQVTLPPNSAVAVTYSVAPTMVKDIQ